MASITSSRVRLAVGASLVLAAVGVAALTIRRRRARAVTTAAAASSSSSPAVTIRLATIADIDRLQTVVNWAYRGKPNAKKDPWTTEKHLIQGPRIRAAQLQELLAKDSKTQAAVFVALIDGVIVGCIKLERSNNICDLGMFSVDPDLQNAGIGRQLLTYAESYGRTTFGSREAHMGVIHTRKELLAWYNRRGYLPTGETAAFPVQDLGETTQQLKDKITLDDVRFDILAKKL